MRENHSEKAVIEAQIKAIPELIHPAGAYEPCRSFERFKILYYLSRPLDWLYMSGFYLKHKGLKEVFAKIGVHIKKHAYSKR